MSVKNMKIRKASVISLIDKKQRELFYNVVLKAAFRVLRSFSLELLYQDPVWRDGKNTFFDDICCWRANLLLTPSYNVRRTPFILFLKWRLGAKLVHWHSEQLISKEFFEEKLNYKYVNQYNRHVDYHMVWGEYFARLLVKYSKVSPDRIYIVGCPKFDLLTFPFYHGERDCFSRRKSRRVLFVSDFIWASMSDNDFYWHVKKYGYSGLKSVRNIFIKAQKRFINCIVAMAKRRSDVDIMLRLHPGESDDPYKGLKSFPNIVINRDGSFSDVLKWADVVFQFLSTSYFESCFLGKPVYCLDIGGDSVRYWRDYFKYYNFISEEDYLSRMDDLIDGKNLSLSSNITDGMREIFSVDLGPSIPRVFFALQHMLRRKEDLTLTLSDYVTMLRFIVGHIVKDMAGRVLYLLWRNGVRNNLTAKIKEAQERYESSEDYFTFQEVENMTERVINEYRYYFYKLGSSTFEIVKGKYGLFVKQVKT